MTIYNVYATRLDRFNRVFVVGGVYYNCSGVTIYSACDNDRQMTIFHCPAADDLSLPIFHYSETQAPGRLIARGGIYYYYYLRHNAYNDII